MAILTASLFNVLIGLALAVVAAVFYYAGLPAGYALLGISVIAVLAIIFGDKLEALPPVRLLLADRPSELAGWWKIPGALTARESVVPVLAMAGCLAFGWASPLALRHAVTDKSQIIFLILTFAVIAYGIKQSGYFKYAAFRVLEVCDGNMTRMVLYLFLLSIDAAWGNAGDSVLVTVTGPTLRLSVAEARANDSILLMGHDFGAGGGVVIEPRDITIDGQPMLVAVDSLNGDGKVAVLPDGRFFATVYLWDDARDGGSPVVTPGDKVIEVWDSGGFYGAAEVVVREPGLAVTPESLGHRDYLTVTGTDWPVDNPNSAATVGNVVVEVEGKEYTVIPDAIGRFNIEHRVSRGVAIPSTQPVTATYGAGEIVKVVNFEVPPPLVAITPDTGLPCDGMTIIVEGMPVYTAVSAVTIGGIDVLGSLKSRTGRDGEVWIEALHIPFLDPGVHPVVVRVDRESGPPTTAVGSLTVSPYQTADMVDTPTLKVISGAVMAGEWIELRVEGIEGQIEITSASIGAHNVRDYYVGDIYVRMGCMVVDPDEPVTVRFEAPAIDPGIYPFALRINAGAFHADMSGTVEILLGPPAVKIVPRQARAGDVVNLFITGVPPYSRIAKIYLNDIEVLGGQELYTDRDGEAEVAVTIPDVASGPLNYFWLDYGAGVVFTNLEHLTVLP